MGPRINKIYSEVTQIQQSMGNGGSHEGFQNNKFLEIIMLCWCDIFTGRMPFLSPSRIAVSKH